MRTIHLWQAGLLPIALMAVFAQPADAGKGKQVKYVGIHPVPKAEGGGVCYIEGPHVHVFAANKLEYRDHRNQNYFVGDPVAYGYDGPRHTYKGHHPIHVHAVVGDDHEDVEYCYLNGPHFHSFAPPSGADFEVRGDVSFYVGEPAPLYVEARPAMIKVNAVYEPLVYTRPVVTVEPPSAWIGIRAGYVVPGAVVVDAPAAVVVPGRVRSNVGIDVHIPTPTLSIGIGVGGHVHGHPGRARGHYKGKHKKWRKRR